MAARLVISNEKLRVMSEDEVRRVFAEAGFKLSEPGAKPNWFYVPMNIPLAGNIYKKMDDWIDAVFEESD